MKYQIDMPDGWKPGDSELCPDTVTCTCDCKADTCPLASAVPVEEPKAPAGLVEEMKVYLDSCADIEQTEYDEIYEIISRYEAEEPLAVLADRKGMKISKIENCRYPVGWLIHLTLKGITGCEPIWQRYDKTVEIPMDDNVDTYAECEAKARAYLMGLKDKDDDYEWANKRIEAESAHRPDTGKGE